MSAEARVGDQIGLYQVKEYLNRGGMAYVVLASSADKDYALKIARTFGRHQQDDDTNQAIRKEAHLLSTLDHERIVRIAPLRHNIKTFRTPKNGIFYSKAAELPECPWYFAMEYLSGGTLEDYVKNCGPLTVREATNIVGNIGLGLGFLHTRDISHNDLKPENVVFRSRITKGQPYDPVLIDLGTAAGVKHFVDEAGSWYVMSPERIRMATGENAPELIKSKIDPFKADMWSLGILLYQALSRTLPFSSPSRRTLTSQILNDIPESIRKWNRAVPRELDQFIIYHCLSKQPKERPTVKQFLKYIFDFCGRGVPAESIKDGYYDKKR